MMKIVKFYLILFLGSHLLMINKKGGGLMDMQQKKSEKQLANEKSDRIMNGVAYW